MRQAVVYGGSNVLCSRRTQGLGRSSVKRLAPHETQPRSPSGSDICTPRPLMPDDCCRTTHRPWSATSERGLSHPLLTHPITSLAATERGRGEQRHRIASSSFADAERWDPLERGLLPPLAPHEIRRMIRSFHPGPSNLQLSGTPAQYIIFVSQRRVRPQQRRR
jgi:hypothetical protein